MIRESLLLFHVIQGDWIPSPPYVNFVPTGEWNQNKFSTCSFVRASPAYISESSAHIITHQIAPLLRTVSEMFPHIMYSQETHAGLLRSLMEAGESAANHPAVVANIVGSFEFKKLEWFMRLLIRTAYRNQVAWQGGEMGKFLRESAPFMHAFLYFVFTARINASPLRTGFSNFYSAIAEFNPINAGRWYFRIPDSHEYYSDDWVSLIIAPPIIDDTVSRTAEWLSLYSKGVQWLSYGAVSRWMADLIPIRTRPDVIALCIHHMPAIQLLLLGEGAPDDLAVQLSSLVLALCKPDIPIEIRMETILPLPPWEPILTRSGSVSLPVTVEMDPALFLESLQRLTIEQVVGFVSLAPQPSFSTRRTFEMMIDRIFPNCSDKSESNFFYCHPDLQGRYFYSPHPSADPGHLRAVGRLIGLLLKRTNNRKNTLSKIVRERHFRASVAEVFFLGSDHIRNGFYDIWSENCVENALMDGEEVLEWLEILAEGF
jgi:hypothetical protein